MRSWSWGLLAAARCEHSQSGGMLSAAEDMRACLNLPCSYVMHVVPAVDVLREPAAAL
jgi:hypothetical protein